MSTERELAWLRKARELSHELVDETEPHTLLPKILAGAIEISGAERGFVIRLLPRGGIHVEAARGFDGASLSSPAGAVSRRVVKEVLERGTHGVVTTRETDQRLLDATTIRERRVLAILCVPMRLRGEAVGVIYLDHRFLPDAFAPSDVEPLRVFADQAALAMESRDLLLAQERERKELDHARERLREHEALERRRRKLLAAQRERHAAGAGAGLGALVGESDAALQAFADLERASRSLDPVLIVGEVGSGKSAAAAELHRIAQRAGKLASVFCANGADAVRAAVSEARGGTLLLEEVGRADPDVQELLVQELQRQRTTHDGTQVVATHTGAPTELQLRPDLMYRLDVLRVDLPALRLRREDIPALLDHFSAELLGRRLAYSASALQRLVDHDWPGNLHELANVVRRLPAEDKTITTRDLPPTVRDAPSGAAGGSTLAATERAAVEEALRACDGNRAKAARLLGIPRSSLYRLLDRHQLR